MTRRGRSPTPADFDEQLDRYRELSSIEDRLLLVGTAGGERSDLRRRHHQVMSAIRRWNVRFLGHGDGDGAPS